MIHKIKLKKTISSLKILNIKNLNISRENLILKTPDKNLIRRKYIDDYILHYIALAPIFNIDIKKKKKKSHFMINLPTISREIIYQKRYEIKGKKIYDRRKLFKKTIIFIE